MGSTATKGLCGQQMVMASDVVSEESAVLVKTAAARVRDAGPSQATEGEEKKEVRRGPPKKKLEDSDSDQTPRGVLEQARVDAARVRDDLTAAAREQLVPVTEAGDAAYRFVYGEVDDGKWDDEIETEGQQHVWTFQDQLQKKEVEELSAQFEATQGSHLDNHFDHAMERRTAIQEDEDMMLFEPPHELDWHLKFPPRVTEGANVTQLVDVPPKQMDLWRNIGLDSLEQGSIGVVMLAGGDGSRFLGGDRAKRLGFSPPVPCMNVGLLSKKSLFQIFCERLQRLHHIIVRRRVFMVDTLIATDPKMARRRGMLNSTGKPVYPKTHTTPVYVMTSEDNGREIEEFWTMHNNFGLKPAAVFFFQQESYPVLSNNGKILMKNRYQFIRRPGGSGGFFRALHLGGGLADMRARGLSGLFVMNTDNLLAKVADPVFLGYCMSCAAKEHDHRGKEGAVRQREEPMSVGMKTIERNEAEERLGFLISRKARHKVADVYEKGEKRRPMIMEPHEAPESLKRQGGDRTHYEYYAADLCQWYFRLDDVLDLAVKHGVPWSAVSTRSPHFSVRKARVVRPPEEVTNSIKLEQAMGGFLQHTRRVVAMHVDRAAEFAPIRSDLDARIGVQSLGMLHQGWIKSAGGIFSDDRVATSKSDQRCEVSPLVSYGGEDLAGLFETALLAQGAAALERAKAKALAAAVAKGLAGSQAAAGQAAAGKPPLPGVGADDQHPQIKKMNLPMHFASQLEKMQGPGKLMECRWASKEDQVRYAPLDQSNESMSALLAENRVGGGGFGDNPDKPFLETAPNVERLPLTPRWLKDEELNWESKQKEKIINLERMLEVEALRGTKRFMTSAAIEALLEESEREQVGRVEEEGKHDGERRPRTRTQPARPEKEEKDGALVYGTTRWFGRQAYEEQVVEAYDALNEKRAGLSKKNRKGDARKSMTPGSRGSRSGSPASGNPKPKSVSPETAAPAPPEAKPR